MSTLIAAVVVWATLTLVIGRRSERSVRQQAVTARVSPARVPPAPVPRLAPTHIRTVASSVDPIEALKRADPWTASNLRMGMDLGLERLVRKAYATHKKDPSECTSGLELAPTVAHVESSMERLAISIRVRDQADLASSARACLADYFAGAIEIGDDEVGGPFPETTIDVDYPLPMQLSRYLIRVQPTLDPPSTTSR